MKKIIFAFVFMFAGRDAMAACSVSGTTYSCAAGYYLSLGNCLQCPAVGTVRGTTPDKNTGDITSCYIPSGTTGSDDTGTFEFTGDSYYCD